jgi:hypothetical protein
LLLPSLLVYEISVTRSCTGLCHQHTIWKPMNWTKLIKLEFV